MQSLKVRVLKVGVPLLAFASAANATALDVTTALSPVMDIIGWLPGFIQALIPVVVAIAVIVAIGGVIAMILGIFKKIPEMLHFKL